MAINHNTIKRWRQRWAKAAPVLAETEKTHRRGLRAAIEDTLEDAPRWGCPSKITSTQFAEIIAMACETPEKYGVPFSHWTAPALAQTVVRRNVVAMVSARQVGRYWNESDLKPHRRKYWLNPNMGDMDEFKVRIEEICRVYVLALEWAATGIQVHSTDERTGIQACERTHAPHPMRRGKREAIEHECVSADARVNWTRMATRS